jgi:hypothetical protein
MKIELSKRVMYLPCVFFTAVPIIALINFALNLNALNWSEILRFVIITIGLVYLWKRDNSDKKREQTESNEFSSSVMGSPILTLMYVFLVVEFIPSSAPAVDSILGLGVYEGISYTFIAMGTISALGILIGRKVLKEFISQFFFKSVNKAFFACFALVALFIWLSGFPPNPGKPTILLIGTFMTYVTIWFYHQTDRGMPIGWTVRKFLFGSALMVFCCVAILGVARISAAFYLGHAARQALSSGDENTAGKLYSQAFDFANALQLDQIVRKDSLYPFFLTGVYRIKIKDYVRAREIFNAGAEATNQYLELLTKLRDLYGGKPEIIQAVWGDAISLSLENFGSGLPKFRHHMAVDSGCVVEAHSIEKKQPGNGTSEHLIVRNFASSPGYNYWILPIGIELRKDPRLGLRVYAKFGPGSSLAEIRLQAKFACGTTGIWEDFVRTEQEDNRYKYEESDLFVKYVANGERHGYDTQRVYIDGVILNAAGPLVDIFIDEVQLFVPSHRSIGDDLP